MGIKQTMADAARMQMLDSLAQELYENETAHGFNADEEEFQQLLDCADNDGRIVSGADYKRLENRIHTLFANEKLALIHSEVSELLESNRKPGPDSHCPDYTSEEIEWADVLIRLLCYKVHRGLRTSAVLAKMKVNADRPFKHGKVC
jgi:hypothetical protein